MSKDYLKELNPYSRIVKGGVCLFFSLVKKWESSPSWQPHKEIDKQRTSILRLQMFIKYNPSFSKYSMKFSKCHCNWKTKLACCTEPKMRLYKQSRRIIIWNKKLFDKIPSSVEVRCLGSEALPADWIILLFKQKRCLAHKCKVRKFNV